MDLEDIWPKKITLSEYRETAFVGNRRPCMTTLKKYIDQKILPGHKLGALYFVWVDEQMNPVEPLCLHRKHYSGTGNEQADQLIAEYLARTLND